MIKPARTAFLCAFSLTVACGAEQSGWTADAWASSDVSAQALRGAASDPKVNRFYDQGGWRPVWDRRRAEALVEAIGQARRHGIDPERYLARIEQATSPAGREEALTLAALSYAEALAVGMVNPDTLHDIYTVERPKPDLHAGLAAALEQGDVADWLESLAPSDPEYRALSDAYLEAVDRIGEAEQQAIPSGDLIRPGDSDPRVPQIAQALAGQGYAAQTDPARPDRYTPALANALRGFQLDSGIAVDGVVGNDTLAVLNTGHADRARVLVLNLERRRWLARNPPERRIDVNTAATILTYYQGGRPAWRTRVVTGQPSTPTPLLGSPITRLVVNPPWYVPQGIAEKEILPKGQGYLRRNDMYVEDGKVIQRPGPGAALGRVKFDMANKYAIYLHDTPAKALFEHNERHRSHGCVRVQDALDFARRLAREEGKEAEFDEKLASGDTATVDLARDIPVRLVYHTAYLDEDGRVAFHPDVYGWDVALAEALGVEEPRRSTVQPVAADLGP